MEGSCLTHDQTRYIFETVLILLEKEFGVLDDLDIDIDSKSKDERLEIVKQLHVIIFNDHSANIGDGNKIKDANIASSIHE